jgi:hypothetical protein
VRLQPASIAIQAPLLSALLPVENGESKFDMMMMMMMDHTKRSGFAFFLDKDGKFFRSDVHMNGLQSGVSRFFELQFDNPSSKDLIGTARTSADEKEAKLDAVFHAILK